MSHYLSPGEYLPHDAPMLLLEEVVSVREDTAVCCVTVASGGVLAPFLDPQGNLPGWFALELMAQTVGVWSGWHRHQQGQGAISLGMVLARTDLYRRRSARRKNGIHYRQVADAGRPFRQLRMCNYR